MDKSISDFRKEAKAQREAMACIVHGLPNTLSSKDQDSFVHHLRSMCGSAFVTGLSVNYYASFWAGWDNFLGLMAE